MIVVDASVAAAWVLPDESSDAAEALKPLIVELGMTMPTLWWAETRNILISAERRGRIAPEISDLALTQLRSLPVDYDSEPEEGAVMTLSRTHGLSVYDALYLELARRKGASLATLDKRLAKAAQTERVALAL